MKYILCLTAVGIGTFLVLKTEWMISSFGSITWADEHLGTEGGSRIFYKVLGVFIIIMAFLTLIGAFNGILTRTFGGALQDTAKQLQPQTEN